MIVPALKQSIQQDFSPGWIAFGVSTLIWRIRSVARTIDSNKAKSLLNQNSAGIR
jgi:hypothetical protein